MKESIHLIFIDLWSRHWGQVHNFCLNELARKGWIKVDRFKNSQNKMGYAYFLTPRGLEEKARLTIHFIRRKAEEYELIRQQIDELHQELEKEQQSVQNT